jgi:aminoglycoside 3-N-acetyltransferase
VLVDGDREWILWPDLDLDDGDFSECGAAFKRERPAAVDAGRVGVGAAKLVAQQALVDFAVEWFETNRP